MKITMIYPRDNYENRNDIYPGVNMKIALIYPRDNYENRNDIS